MLCVDVAKAGASAAATVAARPDDRAGRNLALGDIAVYIVRGGTMASSESEAPRRFSPIAFEGVVQLLFLGVLVLVLIYQRRESQCASQNHHPPEFRAGGPERAAGETNGVPGDVDAQHRTERESKSKINEELRV